MVDYLSGKSTITTSPLSYCDRNQAKDFRLQRQAVISRKAPYPTARCRRNIEMTPLCKIEVTHPGVLGSREVHRGGVVDEQAGVQPP